MAAPDEPRRVSQRLRDAPECPGCNKSMRLVGRHSQALKAEVLIRKTAVGEYLRRARVLGLAWPLPEGVDDAELERRLPARFCGPQKSNLSSSWKTT
jgi:hypothetical protein